MPAKLGLIASSAHLLIQYGFPTTKFAAVIICSDLSGILSCQRSRDMVEVSMMQTIAVMHTLRRAVEASSKDKSSDARPLNWSQKLANAQAKTSPNAGCCEHERAQDGESHLIYGVGQGL